MPEYLSPGVYVEEVSFRAKSIEGLGTTTTGFIGPCRYGPVDLPLDVVTSIGEFERTYGDRQQLQLQLQDGSGMMTMHNYMWHAARAFFEEGGTRLYVSRTFTPKTKADPADQPDGKAAFNISGGGTTITVQARFPGAAGNTRVRFTLFLGENILGQDPGTPPVNRARGVLENDVVAIRFHTSPPSSPLSAIFATAHAYFDTTTGQDSWYFDHDGTKTYLKDLNADPVFGDEIQVVTANVTFYPVDLNLSSLVYSGLALDKNHQLNGLPDSIEAYFSPTPNTLGAARTLPIVVTVSGADNGPALLTAMFQAELGLQESLLNPVSTDVDRSLDIVMTGGNDGDLPTADAYEGDTDVVTMRKTGLVQFEDIDEISIVAAPGSTYRYNVPSYLPEASTILNLLIAHATKMRYRIAVLDSGDNQSTADIRALRSKLDSTYAALYYPWITILDPVTRAEINVPPSGSVCGIYARNDIQRAVYKAPANEVVTLAIGFEKVLNKAQQDVLNPLGINCFRFFEDRGFRLWGARTISSDPEWKYVNLRRYFAYLEHSIDKGTQWAVFEPNGPLLWANVRRTISDFLLNEFQNGALLGDKPETSYFVRCDRSTMTQNDLDNGRLVALIGVAPLRPAEFVIFRIGQWTADH
ncbi:MAG TPA: phage tail sheath subtilisin-like domain-containing protein [Bryobacteraceae bacterium]|nr:phage tail sheath subtilisin-like domain-containing protein [Bryobacteraceae bacterium]